MRTLALIKWENKHGHKKKFRLTTKVSSKWRGFGRLFRQEEDELEGWGVQYRDNAQECWCKVVSQWLHDGGTVDYPATWRGFILALEDMELCEVARELETVLRSAIVHPPAEPPAKPPAEPLPTTTGLVANNTMALSCLSTSHPFNLAPPPRRFFSLISSLTHPILLNEFPSPQYRLLKLMSSHLTPTSFSEEQPRSSTLNSSSPTPSPSPPPSP